MDDRIAKVLARHKPITEKEILANFYRRQVEALMPTPEPEIEPVEPEPVQQSEAEIRLARLGL